jgi:hypothetical protein
VKLPYKGHKTKYPIFAICGPLKKKKKKKKKKKRRRRRRKDEQFTAVESEKKKKKKKKKESMPMLVSIQYQIPIYNLNEI